MLTSRCDDALIGYISETRWKYRDLSEFYSISQSMKDHTATTESLCRLITRRLVKRRLTRVAGTVFYLSKDESYLRKTFKWMFEEGTE